MSRSPKKRTSVETTKASSFVDALRFVSVCNKKDGSINETHVLLNNGWAVAFNGVLAAGHKIDEDMLAAPNNELLITALSKCGENISFTQLDNNRLSIKSDKFKAIIPCIDPELLEGAIPDAPIAPIDDRFKEAIKAVGVLADDDNEHIVTASVLMQGGSLIATDRKVIIQYWHGLDLPPDLPLPTFVVGPLSKTNKKLMAFGFSRSSATFHFEDESWIRTQFYADKWPNVSHILDGPSNPWPVPAGFWEGVGAVAPFSPDGHLHFLAGAIRSHASDTTGASYECAGIPNGPVYSAKQLLLLKPHATSIDFMAPGTHNAGYKLMFFGSNIRGAIAGRAT